MTDLGRRDFLVRTAGTAAFAFVPSADLYGAALRGKEPLAIGLAGVGRQGRAILGELAKFEAAQVVAVCDPIESRRNAGMRRARGAAAYADLATMLEEQPAIQAVVVATPSHLHAAPALEALAAGKHVYCEAPLATTLADCRALAAAARTAGAVFTVGLEARTNPIYGLAETFVRSGALRDVVSLRGQWNKKTSWAYGGGDPATAAALNWRLDPEVSLGLPGEVASHQLDAVSWYLREYPVAVRGRGEVRCYQDGRRVPDAVQLEFEFPGGAAMLYEASLGSSYGGRYELFRGTNATIKMAETFGWMFKEADAPTQGWEVYASRQRFHNDEGITLIADATKLAEQGKLKEGIGLPHPPLYYALEQFLISAAEQKPAAVPAEVGLRAAVLGIKAHEAVAQGGRIVLGEELFQAG